MILGHLQTDWVVRARACGIMPCSLTINQLWTNSLPSKQLQNVFSDWTNRPEKIVQLTHIVGTSDQRSYKITPYASQAPQVEDSPPGTLHWGYSPELNECNRFKMIAPFGTLAVLRRIQKSKNPNSFIMHLGALLRPCKAHSGRLWPNASSENPRLHECNSCLGKITLSCPSRTLRAGPTACYFGYATSTATGGQQATRSLS
ncbi:hypothetical protein C8R47DRAFT_634892 [Mycena vitilis]|nr:hypothetical protein C8R47DRAFT_634892 [Mycena vitilis]